MTVRRATALVAIVAAMCFVASCGSSKKATAPPPKHSCSADRVAGTGDVSVVAPPRTTSEAVGASGHALPCASLVTVAGAAMGTLTFGGEGRCALSVNDRKVDARAVSRDPPGALLRIDDGLARCTSKKTVDVPCGGGSVNIVSAPSRFTLRCDRDPQFVVDVGSGEVVVTDPAGHKTTLGEHRPTQLAYNFDAHQSVVGVAQFDATDQFIFAVQARELGVAGPTVTTAVTSPPPTGATATSAPAQVTVSDVRGNSREAAMQELIAQNLRVVTRTTVDPANDGRVVAQDPQPGTVVDTGSTVTLTIGTSGPPPTPPPTVPPTAFTTTT